MVFLYSPPTFCIALFSNALSNLACRDKEISPISSRKRVPDDNSNLPTLDLSAPVNAPLS